MEIKAGSIVKSASGHDKGLYHAVINMEGDFAFIADGKHRHMDKPKKKANKTPETYQCLCGYGRLNG